jgi:hypothetical protein
MTLGSWRSHGIRPALEVVMGALPEHDGEPDAALPTGLSERAIAILEFERDWWRHAGAKEEAIRSQFGLSAARYYQLLNTVIDSPDAVRHDPMLVRRLQRARDTRTAARASRVFRTPDDEETTH